MRTDNYGPITPCHIVSTGEYWQEMESKRPKPRIRGEDKWIKEIQEQGSVGYLFELQGIQDKIRDIELYNLQKSKQMNKVVIESCKSGKHVRPSEKRRQIKKEKSNETENQINEVEEQVKEEKENERIIEGNKQLLMQEEKEVPIEKDKYLRAHEISGPDLSIVDYPAIRRVNLASHQALRVSVTTAKSAASVQFNRRSIDYIRANAYSIQTNRCKFNRKSSKVLARQLNMENYKMGEVPNYIESIKRKNEQQSSSSISSPTSTKRLLTVTEKNSIITKLKTDLIMWYSLLNQMPISMETLRSRSKKDLIEKQIEDINNRIDIFSKQKVFVEI